MRNTTTRQHKKTRKIKGVTIPNPNYYYRAKILSYMTLNNPFLFSNKKLSLKEQIVQK